MLDGVITFPSSFYALRGEKVVKKANFTCKLIPCPRELSSSCAVSLAFEPAQVEPIAAVIAQNRVQWEAIYIYRRTGSAKEVVEWRG
ncbi:MAG: DUF3343 domain-containing protein [Chloroflexota bacterium]